MTDCALLYVCLQRIASLVEELEALKFSKARIEDSQAQMTRNYSQIADSLSKSEDRCSRREHELEAKTREFNELAERIEAERLQWRAVLDAKTQREADLKEGTL